MDWNGNYLKFTWKKIEKSTGNFMRSKIYLKWVSFMTLLQTSDYIPRLNVSKGLFLVTYFCLFDFLSVSKTMHSNQNKIYIGKCNCYPDLKSNMYRNCVYSTTLFAFNLVETKSKIRLDNSWSLVSTYIYIEYQMEEMKNIFMKITGVHIT